MWDRNLTITPPIDAILRGSGEHSGLKVLLSGTSLKTSYGGPAYSVARLAVALADLGVEVGLWTPDDSVKPSSLIPPGSHVRRLSGSIESAIGELGTPDVIHDNGMWLPHNHRVAGVARRYGVPRIVSTRGMLEPWAMSHKRLKKMFAWPLYQKRDLARAALLHATTSRESANIDRYSLGVPVRVIPNGIDIPPVNHPRPRTDTMRTALFLGRIYPVKGLPMLVDAWSKVRPEGWRLVIAGPDEAGHLAEVQAAVDRANLQHVVSFPGQLEGDSKNDAISNADLVVLPTFSESFGMVIAEALSHGVPVLTTTAAPWSVLEEKDCGWRVPPEVDSLTKALAEATSSSGEKLRDMGQRGRAIVTEQYRWPHIAREFVSAYESARTAPRKS